MISIGLSDITESDLLALIADGVSEGRSVDYKRELPKGNDEGKKEFLADVSSFANTAGGDLILGIEEEKGLPTNIVGVETADMDLELRRLDSMLASGISPRIKYELRAIPLKNGNEAVIVRIQRSWLGPHRVVFKGHDKFYGRNSAGKYPLDVTELRTAFNLSGTVNERIRAFRTDRIIALMNNETPIPFTDTPKAVLHCIPVESFTGQPLFDVLPLYENPQSLPVIASTIWERRLNLDGLMSYKYGSPCSAYTQLYRSGVIEAVSGEIVAKTYREWTVIPSLAFERYILQFLPTCIRILQRIGATAPVLIGLTLTKTRGLSMGTSALEFGMSYPIAQNSVILPEALVEDLSMPIAKILRPIFDLVWNACGYPRSENFDSEDNWIAR
ncbi:MAG: ATP-binding protein [Puia sp.]|nr:ATP-binding protein [Puia sp.]